MQVLPQSKWRPRAERHAAAVEQLAADRLARRVEGRKHPVDDFLWEYYSLRPAQLSRWHPGPGMALEGASERATWSFYRVTDGTDRGPGGEGLPGGTAYLDLDAFRDRRGQTLDFVRELLTATLSRPGRFGCFGLHEWAMVYRADEGQVRHQGWPLRLGAEGTDAVVESHQIGCSHFDAYRFFTPQAAPRNTLSPTREGQVATEQPGCLHAGMDLYKWCYKLSPLVPSELTLRAFVLARDIRELDMRAAPYDLRELGYEPVRIETPQGKAEYVEAQRAFTVRSNALRRELLDVLDLGIDLAAPDAPDAPDAQDAQDAQDANVGQTSW
ncbi:3-methyladenine DNA glycosylase [Ornithinimicrobium sufpigmenti]|uniref:3-methyladenine DNA glycosylase n=1 Tax=Ornithinimicrobium sufpigmenti TaxID=2508882 RepID=UPI001EDFE985|nr:MULTISPECIES: 3-methyladenine DNA glycosylase [unclassified Ornithinimicrobium]